MKKILFLVGFLGVLTGGICATWGNVDAVLRHIHWLHHASFMIEDSGKTIYIDPYEIKGEKPADYIFITHDHPDHLSIKDIKKITGKNTLIICTDGSVKQLKAYNLKVVKPGDIFKAGPFNCEVVPAYNIKKAFHPGKNGNAGYIINIAGVRIYHAGDTDLIPEMKNLKKIGIAMVPIGGFYTMDAGEAARAIKEIKPEIAVPMHFGYRIGKKDDGAAFAAAAAPYARVAVLKEEEPK